MINYGLLQLYITVLNAAIFCGSHIAICKITMAFSFINILLDGQKYTLEQHPQHGKNNYVDYKALLMAFLQTFTSRQFFAALRFIFVPKCVEKHGRSN
jgi:hypothetical protein